jgi:hypothetical protein
MSTVLAVLAQSTSSKETEMDDIFNEIRLEREYQIGKWGTEVDDTKNTPWMWTSYITQYATKWMCGAFTLMSGDTAAFREAMVKVAAIAVAAIESIDRQRKQNGQPFYEEN